MCSKQCSGQSTWLILFQNCQIRLVRAQSRSVMDPAYISTEALRRQAFSVISLETIPGTFFPNANPDLSRELRETLNKVCSMEARLFSTHTGF